jgi:transposase InsO family protein
VIFKGRQVLIPESLRADIIEQLHQGHFGIEKTKRLARESVYWPGIGKEIDKMVKNCDTCQENQPCQMKEPLEPHDIPSTPWTKLASDLFTINGEDYVLITDYYSKYPVLTKLNSTRSEAVARAASAVFSLLGAPAEIITDNGPQYAGQPFKDMCEKWAVKHTTSSPRYPRSNGLAERTVRTVKALIKKCRATGQDLQLAMLNLRATPVDSNLPSPAEMLMGRPIRTALPSYHHPKTLQKDQEINNNLQKKKEKMRTDHDKGAGPELPPLHIGQKVRVQNLNNKLWEPAEVTQVCDEPKSYEVRTPNGSQLRRNRVHIREMPSSMKTSKQESSKTPAPRHITWGEANMEKHNTRPPEHDNQRAEHEPDCIVTRSGRVSRKPQRFR